MITLIRLPAVLERTGLGRSMLYELMERAEFPRPVKIAGGRLNFWSDKEVDDWVAERLAQREELAA